MDRQRDRVDPEEALDHPEDGVEFATSLQPHDQIRFEQVDLVVLHQLTPDTAHHAAGVDDHEIAPLLACAVAEPGERSHQRQQVVLGRRRSHEPERVGVGEPFQREVVGLTDVLEAHGGGGSDRLLGDVGVEVGHGATSPEGIGGGGTSQGALARVEAADEHDGACLPGGSIDEPVVLVHNAPSVIHGGSVATCASGSGGRARHQPASV